MKLKDILVDILKKENKPTLLKDIEQIFIFNNYDYSYNEIETLILSDQSTFANLNGYIFLLADIRWREVILRFDYVTNILKYYYSDLDLQYNVALLFIAKRLLDKRFEIEKNKDFVLNIDSLDYLHSCLLLLVENDKTVNDFIESYLNLLQNTNNIDTNEINNILNNFSTLIFSDKEFGAFFEYLVSNSLNENHKKNKTFNHTSYILRKLMIGVLDPHKDATIYDPVAGLGNLLIDAYNYTDGMLNIDGSEINIKICMLGNLCFWSYGIYDSSIRNENCFSQFNNEKRYDYIIADVPLLGVSLKEYKNLSTNYYVEDLLYNYTAKNVSLGPLIVLVAEKLSLIGKAVLTVSENFLTTKGKDYMVRRYLIENDLIESVIKLPKGIIKTYPNTQASLLVIAKNKRNKGYISFINNISKKNTIESIIDVKEILSLYNNSHVVNKSVKLISLEEFSNGYSLQSDFYTKHFNLLNESILGGNAIKLENIVDFKQGTIRTIKNIVNEFNQVLETPIPLIKTSHLSKDIIEFVLQLNDTSSLVDEKKKNSFIDKECILISKIGFDLKPTIFRPTKEKPKIFLSTSIIALIPKNESIIDIEYLYYQLYSTIVLEQVSLRQEGGVMPSISISALKAIYIPFMSIESQKDFIQSQKANLIAQERAKIDEKILLMNYKEEAKDAELNIVRVITHQLLHHLSSLSVFVGKVNNIVNKHHLDAYQEYDSDEFSKNDLDLFEEEENYTLGESVSLTSRKVKMLNSILTDVQDAIHFKFNFCKTDVSSLLESIKSDFPEINIKVIGHIDEIEISESHFRDLFNTLIKNSIEHSGLCSKDLKIEITLKENKLETLIEIKNNGNVFKISDKEYKSILTKSVSSSGNGIGGFYINQIVLGHQGLLEVVEHLTVGAVIRIKIPKKQILKNDE